ncbi:hypothetical protein [Actinoplanes xinjiangensis]|uniref:Uncharacterized protein n=1 Tax=Actinoplanes xinjiangensis TaxID=512350 RepID=A0A316FAV0_9ACTN|nr:hypothetical protein [Actinoplanes xinjiangensis]PWK44330.1 hypothetical protein BC793_112205 [Actinoplanes xinjiangensis]GIF37910.1 hypothetical protein Axi01nite_22210 [Actinoplanes xinjiangensis]
MAEQRFENFTFHGGQQVFGDRNTVSQTNNFYYGDQRDEILGHLETIRSAAPEPAVVEPEIVIIEQALEHPTAEARSRVEHALGQLRHKLGTVQSATEAVAAIGAIAAVVAQYWPF